MATLTDSSSATISSNVMLILPSYDAIKVTNRLLDGSFHVQTIGTPARICRVTFITDEAGKDLLDVAEGINEPLTASTSAKYYTGTVKEAPEWDRLAPDVYKTTITLLVSAEGAV